MTSNDNYVTVEMFNAGIQGIKSEMNQRFDKLENLVAIEIKNNEREHSYLQNSINTGVTTIGIIIGLVGLIIAVVGVFKKEKKSEISERDMRAMMREEIRMAQNVAVTGK